MTKSHAPPATAKGSSRADGALVLSRDQRRALDAALSAYRNARFSEAEAAFRRLIEAAPGVAELYVHLGSALKKLGRARDCFEAYRRALEIDPNHGMASLQLGTLLFEQGRNHEAEALLRRATELMPSSFPAFNNLGSVLVRLLRLAAAETALRRTIEINPNSSEALQNLGSLLLRQGRMAEAETALRRALALKPDFPIGHSTLLFTLLHLPLTAEQLYREHRAWGERYAPPHAFRVDPHVNDRTVDRRLRIGYVSADFREHAVAYFVEPVFAAHDRHCVEVIGYAHVPRPDTTTQRLRELAGDWRTIDGLDDAALADMIRRDRIDILVDLSGHTAGNRLLAFARKPAPIQVTWIGYPHTLGMPAIDYAIVDTVMAQPGDDRFHVEKLVRLPETPVCYSIRDRASVPSPLPADRNGLVTFGSFNRPTKIGPEVVATWARILRNVPRSRLLLKSVYFAEATSTARLRQEFESHGVTGDRIQLEGKSPRAEYLARFSELDLALDPFPYNGGTTTMDCLAMGVPIVTLIGDRRCGRGGASRLEALGLSELTAHTTDEYAALAVALAGDLQRLTVLRRMIVERFAASPIGDAKRFTRHLEAAYREMWRRWCLGLPPESITVAPLPRDA